MWLAASIKRRSISFGLADPLHKLLHSSRLIAMILRRFLPKELSGGSYLSCPIVDQRHDAAAPLLLNLFTCKTIQTHHMRACVLSFSLCSSVKFKHAIQIVLSRTDLFFSFVPCILISPRAESVRQANAENSLAPQSPSGGSLQNS